MNIYIYIYIYVYIYIYIYIYIYMYIYIYIYIYSYVYIYMLGGAIGEALSGSLCGHGSYGHVFFRVVYIWDPSAEMAHMTMLIAKQYGYG